MAESNTVEIDKGQFETLVGVHNLVDSLMKKPGAKLKLQKLIKEEMNPNMATDEDIAAPLLKPVLDQLKVVTDKLAAREAKDVDDSLSASFERVKSMNGLTEEGVEKLKKFMVDRKIADPEDAYFAWHGRNPPPPAKPTGIGPVGAWGFGEADDEAAKAIWDEGAGFDAYLQKVWNEARG